jgi:signal transduction histidine kinase
MNPEQLDEHDQATLVALYDALRPYLKDVARCVCDAVGAEPIVSAALRCPSQVERLRSALIDWMSTGLCGPHDAAFFAKRSQLGRRHLEAGLAQHHLATAMSLVRVGYLDRIATFYCPDDALRVMRSVDKLFDIELAMMLREYECASNERQLARKRVNPTDRLAVLRTMSEGLAHEVRNPLNSAKLQLDLLKRRQRRTAEDPSLCEPVELALHEIARLTDLLNEFLAFAGSPVLRIADADVKSIARGVVDLERAAAERVNATLELVDEGSVVAPVDAAKIQQVLRNLVHHALESARSTSKAQISVTTSLRDGMLHIGVFDNGDRIADTCVPESLFATREAVKGLGLSIVNSFVTMHGGRLEITTGVSGTLVDVQIPVSRG